MSSWVSRVKGMFTDEEASSEPAPVDGAAAVVRDELVALLARMSEGHLSRESIDPNKAMFEHGYLDSLSYVELMAHVESRWGVRLVDSDLVGRLGTLSALAAEIASKSRDR